MEAGMTTEFRLRQLERAARRPAPRSRFDPKRLTPAEREEFAALQALTVRMGGVGALTDADVERGAALAEKMAGIDERGNA
jgi:hypothetical protein